MALVDLLRDTINEELVRQGDAGLIVWYDRDGSLAPLVVPAMPQHTRLLRFEGSYLALRFALEAEDPRFQGRWVVNVPERPPEESWLRDWELIGARWDLDLLELLRRRANLAVTQRLVQLLRERPHNSRELAGTWESVMGGQKATEDTLINALLALCFGLERWGIDEGILRFVSGNVGRRQLDLYGLWAIWTKKVSSWAGWIHGPTDDDPGLRQRLESAILLSEIAAVLPELASRFGQALPSQPGRAAAALARHWRLREDLRSAYIEAVQRVEGRYELGRLLTANPALEEVETFPGIDDLWRREVINAVGPDGSNFGERVQLVGRIAEKRRRLFWRREGRAGYWEPIALASQLYQGCQQAIAEAERCLQVDEFIHRYAAENGWWELDLWALQLAATVHDLSVDERACVCRPAFSEYSRYLDRVNHRFAEVMHREGWVPQQSGFWTRFVATTRRTAVIFADGLRYDLARYLKALLAEEEFQATFHSLRGMLPSITEVGMSALLPEAEQGLWVTVEGGRLRVTIGSQEVGDRQSRVAWLPSRLSQRGKVIDLDEVERTDLRNVDLVVGLSQEIDEFGSFVADLHPQGLLHMVERIGRAIRHLRDRGFERFLITADHGFLFLPPDVEPRKVDAASSNVCKRRFMVGGSPQGCLVKRAPEVGLHGSELFAFPAGLSVFAMPGEIAAFLHGGMSLQESVVPVLEITTLAPAERVSVEMQLPTRLTSRIAVVTVRVGELELFTRSRKVLVEVNGRRSHAVELGREQPQMSLRISWLGFDELPPGEVLVRLIDAESLQVLQEQRVPVDLVV